MMLLFSQPFQTMDFITDHVRYAMKVWPWARGRNVTWPTFKEYVLPYSFVSEKRDLWFRWRPRMYQLLVPVVQSSKTIGEAVLALTQSIPNANLQGVLALTGKSAGAIEFSVGNLVQWRSETSPENMSPQQVIEHQGSCTGTAIVMAAACRAVGIPARMAGCSESVAGDDHHWVEYWAPPGDAEGSTNSSDNGPFGDGWHTKEGVSKVRSAYQ